MNDKPQRQKILDAATNLLTAGGAQALRVRDIADAAGCSTMGVYSHFGGKEGLADAIYVDGFERFTSALIAAKTEDVPSRGLGHAYRCWALANPGSYLVMFASAVPGHTPSEAALEVATGSFDVLLQTIREEQTRGTIRSGDPLELAWALWGLVHGLVMLEIAGMQPPSPTMTPEAVFEHALAGWRQHLAVPTTD